MSTPKMEVLLLKGDPERCKYRALLEGAASQGLIPPVTVHHATLLAFESVPDGVAALASALTPRAVSDAGESGDGAEARTSQWPWAVVLTSPRAAAAAAAIARSSITASDEAAAAVRGLAWFVVGRETAASLQAEGLEPLGADCGSAAALLPLIVAERQTRGSAALAQELVFACGDMRRDTLPIGLREAGVPFREICVYRTSPKADVQLPSRFLATGPRGDCDAGQANDDNGGAEAIAGPTAAAAAAAAGEEAGAKLGGALWCVYFSPSGVRCVDAAPSARLAPHVRLLAIGPTTAAALATSSNARGRAVAVAAQPSPSGVLEQLVAPDDAAHAHDSSAPTPPSTLT